MELTNRTRTGRSGRFSEAFNLNTKSNAKQHVTVFLWTLIISLVIFIPFVLMDGGHFLYLGDFNCQQIPFYIEVNESIRNGEFFWNWNTDLGANLIGSYAFYLIGSPFFWLTLLIPLSWVGPSIPFLICIKTAVAATTAFAYLKRFLKNRNSAFIGAMLYAFSGFAFYNVFFNHFHDIIALFPLMLFGLEKLMADGKKGWFAAAVFLNALTNYYFFVAEAVFLLIYFTLRLITKGWGKFDWKRFVACGAEAVLGFVLAAFVVLPAVLTTLQIERAGSKLSGWALITYYEVQRPYQILQAFFLPPEVPSAPNVFPDAGARWGSVTAWLPMFGFAGAMTWLQRRPRDFFSKLCVILFVMAFVPVLNAMFQLFSNSYYTRWFFVFVLMLARVFLEGVAPRHCHDAADCAGPLRARRADQEPGNRRYGPCPQHAAALGAYSHYRRLPFAHLYPDVPDQEAGREHGPPADGVYDPVRHGVRHILCGRQPRPFLHHGRAAVRWAQYERALEYGVQTGGRRAD